jgi:cell division protein FtsB
MKQVILIIATIGIVSFSCVAPKEFAATTSKITSDINLNQKRLDALSREINPLNQKISKQREEISRLENYLYDEKRKRSEETRVLEQQINELDGSRTDLLNLVARLRREDMLLQQQLNEYQ